MPRSTAGLFVPLFEAVVLSAICYPAMHAFFSTVSLDYSPAVRFTIFCSLVTTLLTGILELILSAAEKAEFVGQQRLVGPRHALDVANTHCCSSALLLLLFVAIFLQATAFAGQLDSSLNLKRSNGVYVTSQQADWVYSIVGASGGWIFSADRESKIPLQPVTVPFMGSMYGGMVMGYLGMNFLLSVYISYMSTPDSASSYLFMEPRFLVMAGGFLGMGTGQTVAGTYGRCSNPAVSIAGFSCFVIAAAFFDLLLVRLSDRVYMYAKWIGLQALAIVPLFFFLSGEVPGFVKVREAPHLPRCRAPAML